jgi:hypothetical protein
MRSVSGLRVAGGGGGSRTARGGRARGRGAGEGADAGWRLQDQCRCLGPESTQSSRRRPGPRHQAPQTEALSGRRPSTAQHNALPARSAAAPRQTARAACTRSGTVALTGRRASSASVASAPYTGHHARYSAATCAVLAIVQACAHTCVCVCVCVCVCPQRALWSADAVDTYACAFCTA